MRRATRLHVLLLLLAVHPSVALAQAKIEARISRNQLSVGETTTLDVVVRGVSGSLSPPEFDVPPGLEILGSSRQQSFSWVNGKSSSQTVFRFELSPSASGTYSIGPIRVRAGNQTYQTGVTTLSVGAAPTHIGASGSGPAELRVEVDPVHPYIGQPVLMRVRLIQRASLAEDPRYAPPSTPGFWSEESSRPESYYADEGGKRVLVTETRTRMYPISVGTSTIGPATASLALAIGGVDPLQWLRGQVPRREVNVQSKPLDVQVRALPGGAPAGFTGAVGTLSAAWTADRTKTRVDAPVTLRLDLRGIGNLPLIQAPALDSDTFEIFASTVDDSMPAIGRLNTERRRFMWTALPRREGRLRVAAPQVAWFDPARGAYVTANLADIVVDVGPALPGGGDTHATLPRVLGDHPLDPFRKPALPWTWALGGLAIGLAVTLWRHATRTPFDAADRARQREWLRVVGLAKGANFWRAAEEATAWMEGRGLEVQHLRREVAAARYGGTAQNAESIRRRVVELLGSALPPARPGWPLQATALIVVGGAVVLCVFTGPRGGGVTGVVRAQAADRAAADGRMEEARSAWASLWREGARAPGLAARLAWSHVSAGEFGPAAVWVLRGEARGGRDPALAWVREQVREGGGLAGDDPTHVPVRPIEWAVLALFAGFAAGASVVHRRRVAWLLALMIALAAVRPVESLWQGRTQRAVVRSDTRLEGPDLDLEAGHVVRVLSREGERVRVSAGHGVEGWLPNERLFPLGPA